MLKMFAAEGKGTANNGNLDSSGDSSDDENEADGLATSDQVRSCILSSICMHINSVNN